ncbi:Methylenetetrahydrofolate dehydrogenase [NAD(+)] [Phytophthora oleae]|uniref:Methylenetetrahydrofolate dehydrogenase [NAD(+)] n=1 Tax=Phytophthora oleae TaxID=2107226 RepID=A0ABD3FUK6_9STRA
MPFTPCQVGDALLGQLARAFVLVVALLIPTMANSICWDYSDEEMGPLVPEWSSESDTNFFNWSARRAEFA